MPRNFVGDRDVIQLRNVAAAITATAADSAKNNSRIGNSKGGLGVVVVNSIDATSGDEQYVITIEGRDTVGSGSYTVLGTVTLKASDSSAAVGTFLVSLDTLKKEMRANCTISGTTPSILHQVLVVGEKPQYMPSAGTAITA